MIGVVMDRFLAITQAGTVYRSDGVDLVVSSVGAAEYVIPDARLVSLKRETAVLLEWEEFEFLAPAPVPVEGELMFITGARGCWRLSTPVRKVFPMDQLTFVDES